MLTKRIIPCLDVTGGRVVKGVNFINLRDASDEDKQSYYEELCRLFRLDPAPDTEKSRNMTPIPAA